MTVTIQQLLEKAQNLSSDGRVIIKKGDEEISINEIFTSTQNLYIELNDGKVEVEDGDENEDEEEEEE
ncbi:hypothetical protein [Anabaena azotica]|uniref:Uncharacterized protein n=1 Tax=Anabaena azotica FACHB-119 TaxID=947527 RepID=A0ABR8D7L0_9NOST|nr:hypothetical protein [Anabaena azotica]MBD2503147.1 hypothetical protein [Anabaena azotica FACHB-119]